MSRSVLLISLVAAVAAGSSARAADVAHPVVIELFQSQGCSSCPPANATLNALAARPDVIGLSFGVTYWDQLGWKDTFASPAYTKRQWDYAHAAGRAQVATPQMIIDGRFAVNGGNRAEVVNAVRHSPRSGSGPTIMAASGAVSIGRAASARPATVWLVRYDPRVLDVPIRAGENGGKTLPHRNIVRSLDAIGRWNGAPASFKVSRPTDSAYRSAILIQQENGGPIVAAARI